LERDWERELPALRKLRQLRIPYTVVEFDPGIRSALDVAAASGYSPGEVFKTLVAAAAARSPAARPILAVIPAVADLDLKRLSACAGGPPVRLVSHREAEQLTGLQVGGISALALTHKRWRVFLDASASELESLVVSAGARGLDVRLSVDGFVAATAAELAPISRPASAADAPEGRV
jgi:Cys-tRNA(Pro)/Cys-tRNA(Cys) deacylase